MSQEWHSLSTAASTPEEEASGRRGGPRRLGAGAFWCPGFAARECLLQDVVISLAFDDLAALDPIQVDAGYRLLFTRRFDVTDMLSHLMLSFMCGDRGQCTKTRSSVWRYPRRRAARSGVA